jgi:hypothetical protein
MKGKSYFSALVGLLLFLAVMMFSATGRAGVNAHSMHFDAAHNEMHSETHVAHFHTGAEAHLVADAVHTHKGEFHSDDHGEETHS